MNQKKLAQSLLALCALSAAGLAPQAHAAACNGIVGHVHAISLEGSRTTTVNYTANPDNLPAAPGRFDPKPLLQGAFTVPAGDSTEEPNAPSCITATFSSQVYNLDNGFVYQVQIDGKPMAGHAPTGPNGLANPAVFQSTSIIFDTSNNEIGRTHGQSDLLSNTFFASVKPGRHVVRVLMANCCSSVDVPGGGSADTVQAATLTVTTR